MRESLVGDNLNSANKIPVTWNPSKDANYNTILTATFTSNVNKHRKAALIGQKKFNHSVPSVQVLDIILINIINQMYFH